MVVGIDASETALQAWEAWSGMHKLVRIDFESGSKVSGGAQRLRLCGRLGKLRVRKTVFKVVLSYEIVYLPTRCTFEPIREGNDGHRYNDKTEVAVLDTLADTLPEEGGTIKCIQWMKWEDNGRHTTGALILAEVDEDEKIYRRIGWLDVQDDDFFEEDETTIILV